MTDRFHTFAQNVLALVTVVVVMVTVSVLPSPLCETMPGNHCSSTASGCDAALRSTDRQAPLDSASPQAFFATTGPDSSRGELAAHPPMRKRVPEPAFLVFDALGDHLRV